MTSPIHGIALPPKHLQNDLPNDWLDKLSTWGYQSLALQNDPTLPRKGSEENHREALYRLHFLVDLGAEQPRAESLEYFQMASQKAKSKGLRVYLDCWEPVIPISTWEKFPPEWQGHRQGVPHPMSLDITHPDAMAWYWSIVQRCFERLPHVDGIILGREDNEAILVESSNPNQALPPLAKRWADFYATFHQKLKSVRPELDMILYDWWWAKGEHDTILQQLPPQTPVITRFENNTTSFNASEFVKGESLINDVTVSAVNILEDSKPIIQSYQKRGNPMYAMIPFLGPIEAFMQPYTLSPNMYFGKLKTLEIESFAGWMDYDCGGIDDGMTADILKVQSEHPHLNVNQKLKTLIDSRYGSQHLATLKKAFDHGEQALKAHPTDLFSRDNRMLNALGISGSLCMGLPINPALAWSGRRDWERTYQHWFNPHSYTEPRSLERLLLRLPMAVQHQQEASQYFQLAVHRQLLQDKQSPKDRAQLKALEYDAALAEAYLRILKSLQNFMSMAQCLQHIRRDMRLRSADLETLQMLLSAEIENTRQFEILRQQHPEFYANSTHDVWHYLHEYDERLPKSEKAIQKKIEILEQLDWSQEILALCPLIDDMSSK